MSDEVSLNDVTKTIRAWRSEVLNFRNDGWTQKAYRDKLREVSKEVAKAIDDIKNHK